MINQFRGLTKTGRREKNEDCIYPLEQSSAQHNLFLVCDGVGGNVGGEIASRITCDIISQYFDNTPKKVDEQYIENVIKTVERKIDEQTERHPNNRGMSTTLTLLYLQAYEAILAHIGDSRIYHIRNGEVLYQTRDHSLVNDLITTGYITEEEALTHPKRNVITRAISGTDMPTPADVYIIEDIKVGDYFLLCSDGVIEGIDNNTIKQNFLYDETTHHNDSNYISSNLDRIITVIDTVCSKYAHDNYSALIVQITDIRPIDTNNT